MAVIDLKVLSKIIGPVGIRLVNGKTILYARPKHYKVSMAPSAVLPRHKFAVASNFVKNVVSLPSLKEIWHKSTPTGMRSYNFALKRNFAFTSEYSPTIQNIITPGGFSLPVYNAALSSNYLVIDLLELNTAAKFTRAEVNLSTNALVCYINPVNTEDPAFQIITLNKEIDDYNFGQVSIVTIPINILKESVAVRYTNSIIYFAAATKNRRGKIIQYSSTVVREKGIEV